MLAAMRIISWNLLRLEGAAVGDVVALLERERPDVLLMQEVTQHMDVLPSRISGHYHRLPWPGRIHRLAVEPLPFRPAARVAAADLAPAGPLAAPPLADRAGPPGIVEMPH